MAIIPTTQNKVALYAAGLYGMKLGSATNSAVLFDVQNNPTGVNGVLNGYYAPFASMTSAQVAAIVVANVGIKAGQYGLTAQNVADAVATVTAELNAAAPFGKQGETIANVLTDFTNTYESNAVYGAAAKAWNVKIAQAVSYTGNSAVDTAFGEIVTEFRLSAGGENRTGTAGDDTFIAVDGTFNNADRVNGGAGNDILKAQVSGVVAPNVSGVEHLQFQAQFRNAVDSSDNNVGNNSTADETTIVKVDFNTNVTNVTGFNTIENSNSRADLIVEDVRIANNQITKDITIVMRETDPGNVDYGVYFDQNSLRTVSNSTSQINLQVMDTRAVVDGKAPLLNSPYGGFVFTATDNNGASQVVTLESAAIDAAQTYAELAAAFQVAADAKFGAGVVTVSVGSNFTVTDTTTGTRVTGQEVILKTAGAYSFSTPVGSGWKANGVVPANSGLHTDFNQNNTSTSELVTSTIILDDVGRGSTGGDLVVGGLSVGETSTSKGVQKFLIEVQDNSKLQTINSTNNTLREVVLTNGVTSRVDNAYNENEKNAGSLTVRGIETPNNGHSNNSLPGIDTLTGVGTNHGDYGFTDVQIVDGTAFKGKLDFDAQITSRSIAKYLNLKDAAANPAGDNVAFKYSGGLNKDVISVVADGDVLASRSLSGREDFSLTVDGGAGDDSLTVQLNSTTSAAWLADQQQLKNLFINGGEGNDVIRKPGQGNAKIDAGVGNDTVYAENTGVQTVTVAPATTETHRATWLVNASNANLYDLRGDTATAGGAREFLYKGKLTVTFAGMLAGASAAAAEAVNGYEVTVDVPTGDNYAVTQYHINQAIKAAINGNAVMNKLLVAEDGPAATLVIKSLIDGEAVKENLSIAVSADALPAAGAELTAINNAYKAFMNDLSVTPLVGGATQAAVATINTNVIGLGANQKLAQLGAAVDLAGADGTAHSDNVIALGAGDDVAVLGTSATDNDSLVYAGYAQGKDTIVNFVAGLVSGTGAVNGADTINFAAYLDGKVATTGAKAAVTLTTGTSATADVNEVVVLTGFQLSGTATAAENNKAFAELTAEKLLAAIKNTGSVAYGTIGATTLESGPVGGTHAGNTGKSVVLIENSANQGEYAAFELTFGAVTSGTEFTDAKMIGVLDFGSTQSFHASNFVI